VGNLFWGNSIYKSDFTSVGLDLEFIPLFIKNIPLFLSIFGIFIAILFNTFLNFLKNLIFLKKKNYNNLVVSYPQSFSVLFWFFFHKWYFDYIYNYYFGYTILNYSYECFYKLIDKGFIEILSVQGLSNTCYKICSQLSYIQLGLIYHLSCFLILGLILLFFFIIII
jgi:hypothetical protein